MEYYKENHSLDEITQLTLPSGWHKYHHIQEVPYTAHSSVQHNLHVLVLTTFSHSMETSCYITDIQERRSCKAGKFSSNCFTASPRQSFQLLHPQQNLDFC